MARKLLIQLVTNRRSRLQTSGLYTLFTLFIIKIKFNKIETSNHGIGFNIKQLMTDDGFMRSLDLSVNYIDKDQNLIDFLKVKY